MPDDPRISSTTSLGTDFAESLGQFDAVISQGRANLQDMRRNAASLEKTYRAVFGKHATAFGAEEMRIKILDLDKKILKEEQRIAETRQRAGEFQKRQSILRRSEENRASLWMMNARMRGEAAEQTAARKAASSRKGAQEFEEQFAQFRHIKHRIHMFGKVGRLAMGADIAIGGKDLGAIAWGMESIGQYFQETPGAGRVGRALGAIAPWLIRAAGPLMLAYMGGELAKAAISHYYEPRIDAARMGGEAAAGVGVLARDPSANMDQLMDLLRQTKAAQGESPERARAAFAGVARQARDIGAGRKPITSRDVSRKEAYERIIRGDIRKPGYIDESKWWRNYYRERKFAVQRLFGYGDEMIETTREQLAVERSEQREIQEKMTDESLKERRNNPEYRVKRLQMEMTLSAINLDRTRSRMLAPTI